MPPSICFKNISNSQQRINVDINHIVPSNTGQVIHLTPPSSARAFGRIILDIFTLGIYSSKIDNPKEWGLFRNALDLQYQSQNPDQYRGLKSCLDIAFANYHHHTPLTQSKVNNILAEIEARSIRETHDTQPAPSTTPLRASQSLLIRALRSLKEIFRTFTADESELSNKAHLPSTHNKTRKDALAVLQHGCTMNGDPIARGQEALKAGERDYTFAYTDAGLNCCSLNRLLSRLSSSEWKEEIERLKKGASEGKPSILSIPFLLYDDRSPALNHFVLIAADFKNKKILYLDSKATSLDVTPQIYNSQGNDFRKELSTLGLELFLNNFDSKRDILELAYSKQQGGNDCGAFVHTFTKLLLQGSSPADIDRMFDHKMRATLRYALAKDILTANFSDDHQTHGLDLFGLWKKKESIHLPTSA